MFGSRLKDLSKVFLPRGFLEYYLPQMGQHPGGQQNRGCFVNIKNAGSMHVNCQYIRPVITVESSGETYIFLLL